MSCYSLEIRLNPVHNSSNGICLGFLAVLHIQRSLCACVWHLKIMISLRKTKQLFVTTTTLLFAIVCVLGLQKRNIITKHWKQSNLFSCRIIHSYQFRCSWPTPAVSGCAMRSHFKCASIFCKLLRNTSVLVAYFQLGRKYYKIFVYLYVNMCEFFQLL